MTHEGAPTKLLSHIRHQWPVIRTLGTVMASSSKGKVAPIPTLPTPEIKEVIAPRPVDLVEDFIRYVGGDCKAYKGLVPFHMFPQWCIPIGFRNTLGLPFDFRRIINLGVKATINGPLRIEEPFHLRSSLLAIEEEGKKVRITTRFVTETSSSKDALVADLITVVPALQGKSKTNDPIPPPSQPLAKRPKLSDTRVGYDMQFLETLQFGSRAGWDFAVLTGDFNPLHWLPQYARMMGFRAPILHGYASMSHTIECLIRHTLGSDPTSIKSFEVMFTNPLTLPGQAGVYYKDGTFCLGAAIGSKAYLKGQINGNTLHH